MAFLIELTDKKTHEKQYAGVVFLGYLPTHRIRRAHPRVTVFQDNEIRLFHTLGEAKPYGFQSTQEARFIMSGLQKRFKNVDYKIVKFTPAEPEGR
jgi:hypothetical protein